MEAKDKRFWTAVGIIAVWFTVVIVISHVTLH